MEKKKPVGDKKETSTEVPRKEERGGRAGKNKTNGIV